MTRQTLLILDLDGVVSPLTPTPRVGVVMAAVGAYRLYFRPETVRRLNALSRQEHLQVRWLTSWGEDARSLVAPALGLEDFPLLGPLPRPSTAGIWPKHAAVRQYVPLGARFAWVDDDLTPTRQRRVQHAYGSKDCLLVRPDRTVGITSKDLDKIEAFVNTSGSSS